jgi:hypothetical protein
MNVRIPVFRNVTSCTLVDIYQCCEDIYLLQLTLKMVEILFCERWEGLSICQTTRLHIHKTETSRTKVLCKNVPRTVLGPNKNSPINLQLSVRYCTTVTFVTYAHHVLGLLK